jgi:hypothetical protein
MLKKKPDYWLFKRSFDSVVPGLASISVTLRNAIPMEKTTIIHVATRTIIESHATHNP